MTAEGMFDINVKITRDELKKYTEYYCIHGDIHPELWKKIEDEWDARWQELIKENIIEMMDEKFCK